jgi:transcription elongation factor Elf1
MFPQICVLWHNTQIKVIAINSRIHIWDTYFSCNLWSYCSMHNSVHKTKNRPLYLFYTDCNNSNSVTIRPSLYEIFVFSFFTDIYSTSQYFSIYVIVNFADTSMKPFWKRSSTYH